MDYLRNTPSCKIYCKDDPNFTLTIRNGRVVLAPSNPNDDCQHWYRDERYGYTIKDAIDLPSFSLINKASGLAIMHPVAPSQPVQLTPYNPNAPNACVLWTEDGDMGDGYKAVRMVNDINLNFDADGGRVWDGVELICYQWTAGNNQYWKIEPYNYQPSNNYGSTFKIYCKAGPNFSLTIRNGMVVLAPSNPSDQFQHWYKNEKYSQVQDASGLPSFSLINKANNQAIKHAHGSNLPVQLVPYNANAYDESILWTADGNLGDGYSAIRMMNNISLNFDAYDGRVYDGVQLICYEWNGGDNQKWIIGPHY